MSCWRVTIDVGTTRYAPVVGARDEEEAAMRGKQVVQLIVDGGLRGRPSKLHPVVVSVQWLHREHR